MNSKYIGFQLPLLRSDQIPTFFSLVGPPRGVIPVMVLLSPNTFYSCSNSLLQHFIPFYIRLLIFSAIPHIFIIIIIIQHHVMCFIIVNSCKTQISMPSLEVFFLYLHRQLRAPPSFPGSFFGTISVQWVTAHFCSRVYAVCRTKRLTSDSTLAEGTL